LVIENKKRLDYIVSLIIKAKKNTLVLYNSVEKEYGLKIKEAIRELETDKEVFYIDGSTKQELRNIYKKKMETDENIVLIASFGTTSTGISIKNIHNIFMVESFKSEKIIKQTIGRGLRQLKGKEKVNIYDIVDDFRVYKYNKQGEKVLKYKRKNLLLKHAEDRMQIYINEGHKLSKYNKEL
jgi:superfamily II DNA or RNA helicase